MTKPLFDRDALLDAARKLHPLQVKWRRRIHQHPEIANQEFETTDFIREECRRLGLKLKPIKMKTGVLAELTGSGPGPTVAIRSDIDALPVTERTGLPFASKVPGRMHACGHDVHTAIVLGTAALLSQLREQVRGTVRFIFQPAEEEPPGGAQPMIANGALDGVKVIFGLHVDSSFPTGKVGFCDGAMMASVYDFDLTIEGKGGHAARPHLAVDAIAVAAEVIESLQKVISREINPLAPTVMTFGRIEGGTVRNVIADAVRVYGTARSLSPPDEKRLPRFIKRTVAGLPMVFNDPAVNRLEAEVFTSLFGRGRVVKAPVSLGGEDFAFYVQKVPGAMFRLGVGNRAIGADKPWHSPLFVVDEEAIFYATALLAGSTLTYLG
jgi:amidohydrolase